MNDRLFAFVAAGRDAALRRPMVIAEGLTRVFRVGLVSRRASGRAIPK